MHAINNRAAGVIFGSVLSILFAGAAHAASSKRIEHSIDANEFSHIDFEISVAELDIEVYNGDTVEIDIEIRAERDWWIFGRRNVDDVNLSISEDRDSLELVLDEDNIEQDWRVRLPAHLAVSLEMGVGEIDIAGFNNDLNMELGVGSVRDIVADEDFETVHISTGVGDSNIRGFSSDTDNERSLVGADSYYHGDGEHEVQIEVGVGEASIVRR